MGSTYRFGWAVYERPERMRRGFGGRLSRPATTPRATRMRVCLHVSWTVHLAPRPVAAAKRPRIRNAPAPSPVRPRGRLQRSFSLSVRSVPPAVKMPPENLAVSVEDGVAAVTITVPCLTSTLVPTATGVRERISENVVSPGRRTSVRPAWGRSTTVLRYDGVATGVGVAVAIAVAIEVGVGVAATVVSSVNL